MSAPHASLRRHTMVAAALMAALGLAACNKQDDRTASLTLLHGGRQLVVDRIADRPLAVEMAQRIRARTGA